MPEFAPLGQLEAAMKDNQVQNLPAQIRPPCSLPPGCRMSLIVRNMEDGTFEATDSRLAGSESSHHGAEQIQRIIRSTTGAPISFGDEFLEAVPCADASAYTISTDAQLCIHVSWLAWGWQNPSHHCHDARLGQVPSFSS